MKTLEEAQRIKDRVESELLKRPGVTGIDVGYSPASGQVPMPVIRVYVADPEARQSAGLPADIEGVPVVLIERRFQLH